MLPKQQQLILDFIIVASEENACPPTLTEIGTFLGGRSINLVRQQLRALEKKGYIKITPNVARGITILRSDDETGVL